MVFPYLDHDGPAAFAHRGGNTTAPENTVASFAHSVDLGYQYLETDVHLTADGRLVAFHDPDLERLTGQPGSIGDYRWDEIETIELADGHRIPSLDELLTIFPRSHFNIDPKSDSTVWPLVEAIRDHGAIDRVGIGSFSDDRIDTMIELLGPRLCVSPGPQGVAAVLAEAHGYPGRRHRLYGCLQIPRSKGPLRLSAGLVRRVQSLGLEVHVWTINERASMHRLLDMGVDALMTDNTDLLKEVMVGRCEW